MSQANTIHNAIQVTPQFQSLLYWPAHNHTQILVRGTSNSKLYAFTSCVTLFSKATPGSLCVLTDNASVYLKKHTVPELPAQLFTGEGSIWETCPN